VFGLLTEPGTAVVWRIARLKEAIVSELNLEWPVPRWNWCTHPQRDRQQRKLARAGGGCTLTAGGKAAHQHEDWRQCAWGRAL